MLGKQTAQHMRVSGDINNSINVMFIFSWCNLEMFVTLMFADCEAFCPTFDVLP